MVGAVARGNEIGARYAFVDPVLRALGWCTELPWECRLGFRLGPGRPVDYTLFDRDGFPTILIEVEALTGRRRDNRNSLWRRVRGRRDGLAVLAYGLEWEIYDLSVPARGLDEKRAAWVDVYREASSDLHIPATSFTVGWPRNTGGEAP